MDWSWRFEWRKKLSKFELEDFRKVNNKIYLEEFGESLTADDFKCSMNREKVVLEELSRFEWSSLLDVGCQHGKQLFQVDATFPGKQLAGVDISNIALRIASQMIPSAKLTCCAAEKMPFDNSQFDVVMVTEALEHFFDEAVVLKEVHRILKPNGVMLGTTPIGENYDGGAHLRYYDYPLLHNQLEQYFIIEKLEEIGVLLPTDKPTGFYFKCKKGGEFGMNFNETEVLNFLKGKFREQSYPEGLTYWNWRPAEYAFGFENIKFEEMESFLDTGAMHTFISVYIASMVKHVVATDSFYWCARENYGGAAMNVNEWKRFLETYGVEAKGDDLQRMVFDSDSFDVVWCISTLEHVIDDNAAIKELWRVAKKYLYITVDFGEYKPYAESDGSWFRTYNMVELKKLLGNIPGAKVVAEKVIGREYAMVLKK